MCTDMSGYTYTCMALACTGAHIYCFTFRSSQILSKIIEKQTNHVCLAFPELLEIMEFQESLEVIGILEYSKHYRVSRSPGNSKDARISVTSQISRISTCVPLRPCVLIPLPLCLFAIAFRNSRFVWNSSGIETLGNLRKLGGLRLLVCWQRLVG